MVETLKWAAQTRDVGTKPSAHTTIRTIGKWKEIRLPLGYIAEKAKRPDEYQLERVLCLNRDDEDDVIEDVFVDQREYPPTLFLYIDDHPFPNCVPRECHSNATTVVNNQIFRAVYNADDLSLDRSLSLIKSFPPPLFFFFILLPSMILLLLARRIRTHDSPQMAIIFRQKIAPNGHFLWFVSFLFLAIQLVAFVFPYQWLSIYFRY